MHVIRPVGKWVLEVAGFHRGKYYLQRGSCTNSPFVTALVASRLPRLLVVCMGDSDLSANTHQLLPERWENLKSVMSSGSKRLS